MTAVVVTPPSVASDSASSFRRWSLASSAARWELAVNVFDIQKFLLPKPCAIWQALVDDWTSSGTAPQKTGWVAIRA